MNYKCFLARLSLMCFVSQIRAWTWLESRVLTVTLVDAYNNGYTFRGYNVEGDTDKDKSFRLKICKDATKDPHPMFRINNKVGSTVVIDLKINIKSEKLSAQTTKKAFYCGTANGFKFYYGQGPYENSIAVYATDPTIQNSIADAHGIMTYDLD